MQALARWMHLVLLLSCPVVAGLAHAQTPLPNTPPKIALRALAGITLSPTSVTVSSTTKANIAGAVTLVRQTNSDLQVGLTLVGGKRNESNMWVADGVVVPASVKIPAGSSKGSFTITIAEADWSGTRSLSVEASSGSGRKSTGFTVITQP